MLWVASRAGKEPWLGLEKPEPQARRAPGAADLRGSFSGEAEVEARTPAWSEGTGCGEVLFTFYRVSMAPASSDRSHLGRSPFFCLCIPISGSGTAGCPACGRETTLSFCGLGAKRVGPVLSFYPVSIMHPFHFETAF